MASDILLPVPSSLVSTFAASQLGVVAATAVSWLGMTLGAMIGFYLAKTWGRALAVRLAAPDDLEQMDRLGRHYGAWIVVFTRALPVLAEAAVLLAGATQLAWRQFLPGVMLSNLGIAVVYSLLGAWAQTQHQLPLALAASIALPILAATITRWFLRKRLARRSPLARHMRAPMSSSRNDVLEILDSADPRLYDVHTTAPGPRGSLPLTEEMLRDWPSGDLFGLTQNAGMGWEPAAMVGPQFLLLSTQGGVRADDGTPIALGYHTGHWEVGLLVQEAARVLKTAGAVPFAAYCSDPCDGRTQGTVGMFDSLPYRNDAAIIFRRLIRSLPTRRGVLGVATCDKGLPAMMLALAGMRDLPCVLVPGGVSLPPTTGEDAGKIQSIGARYAHGEITLEDAAELGCRACASPGGGCQFLGTAATAQVVGEALGLSLPHSALAPSGQPIWLDMARAQRQGPAGARAAQDQDQRHPHRRVDTQRHGRACRVWRLDQSVVAHSGHCPCRRLASPDGRRLAAKSTRWCRGSSTRCPTARWDIRPCACFWPAACPRSCCTCASWDCSISTCSPSPAARWARCSIGGRIRRGAPRCARRCGRATASMPTT